MKTKIAINGFGRIGRLFFRQIFNHNDLEIVAVNDLGNVENLAYLLKYDTVYGRWHHNVKSVAGKLIVDGREIIFRQEKDAIKLPWGEMGVDIVVE